MNARIPLAANPLTRSVLSFMLSVPAWATWLIALVLIPAVLGVVIYCFAEPDNPGNQTVHNSGEPPDSDDDRDGVLLAAA